VVVGTVIGSGIFRTPSSIAKVFDDPVIIMGLWVFGGAICLCGALSLAELAALFPRTGGSYVYLREAYGDAAAFTFGWLYLLAAIPSGMAALAVFFGEQLVGLFPGTPPAAAVPAVAIALIAALSAANIVGVRLASRIQQAFTVIKVAALAGVILLAAASGAVEPGHFRAGGSADSPLLGLAAALAYVLFAYNGWVYLSMVAGELEAPERSAGRVLLWGMLAVTALYVLANAAYIAMVPVPGMRGKIVAEEIVARVLGSGARAGLTACILCSVFGSMNGVILTKSRVAYALARDGLGFSVLGRCHPRWATPHVSIAVQGVLAVLLIVWLRDFDRITPYFVVVEWLALLFTIAAVFVLRRRRPDAPRPYRVPAYPWVPGVFVVGVTVGLAAIVWSRIALLKDYAPLIGLAVSLAGFPVYAVWRWLARARIQSA
jgi:APA family basic amino acid/polyamine antiporter